MRNPVLTKLSRISRLPSTNMEVRLDSTIDALPNVSSSSYESSGTLGTEEKWAIALFSVFAGSTNMNSSRAIYELTASVNSADQGRYTGYVTIVPSTTSTYNLSNTAVNGFQNTQIEPYVYGDNSSIPTFGVLDTGVSASLPVTHLKMNRLGSTFDYSSSFILKQGGVLVVSLYFAAVEADEITARWPSSVGTVSIALRNITPGNSYGTVCASCTGAVNLRVS